MVPRLVSTASGRALEVSWTSEERSFRRDRSVDHKSKAASLVHLLVLPSPPSLSYSLLDLWYALLSLAYALSLPRLARRSNLGKDKTPSSTNEVLILYLFLFRGILGSVIISAPVAVMLLVEREVEERKRGRWSANGNLKDRLLARREREGERWNEQDGLLELSTTLSIPATFKTEEEKPREDSGQQGKFKRDESRREKARERGTNRVTAVQSSFQWVKLAAPALIIGSVDSKKGRRGKRGSQPKSSLDATGVLDARG